MSWPPPSPTKKNGWTHYALLSSDALRSLQKSYDVELTYTSNAIEGNTLTLRETAELIEHGITVGGKPLHDHLEAVDHYQAVLRMRELASGTGNVTETTVRELHRLIVLRSQPEIGDIYSTFPRRIVGSPVVFPNPAKIAELMKDYGEYLSSLSPSPTEIFTAHFRQLPSPCDGNGRTARLLINSSCSGEGIRLSRSGPKTGKHISTRLNTPRCGTISCRSRTSCIID